MTHLRPIFGSAVLGMFFTAHGAWAGVTPNDVWQDWRDYMQGMGYKLTATKTARIRRLPSVTSSSISPPTQTRGRCPCLWKP